MRTDGKVDKKTFDALCGKGKKINKTSTTETTTFTMELSPGTDMTGASISTNNTVTVKAKDMRDFDAVVNASKNNVVVIDTSKKNLKTTTTVKKNGTTVTKSSGKSTKVSTKSGKNNKNKTSGKSSGKNNKSSK